MATKREPVPEVRADRPVSTAQKVEGERRSARTGSSAGPCQQPLSRDNAHVNPTQLFDLDRPRNAANDRELQAALYQHYKSYIATIARRNVLSLTAPGYWPAVDVDDVTQEIWLDVLEHLGNYKPERASFKAWLCIVAKFSIYDARERNQRRAARCPIVPECDHSESEANFHAMPDVSSPDPLGRAEANDFWCAVCSGFDPQVRAVVLLRHRHGLTYSQIGPLTGTRDHGINLRLKGFERRMRKNYAHLRN